LPDEVTTIYSICFRERTKFVSLLLGFADNDPLEVIVGVLGTRPEDCNVNPFAPLTGDLRVVVDLQVISVKSVTLNELAQHLLHKELFGEGLSLLPVRISM
jgi:hypothetical protein